MAVLFLPRERSSIWLSLRDGSSVAECSAHNGRVASSNLARPSSKDSSAPSMWIIELEEGVWIAPWNGDPGRTLVQNNAQRFRSERGARQALRYARQHRSFANAVVLSEKN